MAAYFGIAKKKTIINSTKYPTEATQLSIIGAVTDDKDAYTAQYRGGCHAPARPYAPVSKPGLLDEGRVPRGVQGRAGA